LRQTQHAAPTGEDAQHHFRQAQAGTGLIDHEERTTGQRQFQTAPEAVTTHHRQGGITHGGQSVEKVPAPRHHGFGGLGALQFVELADVGTGDKTGFLAGANHQGLGRCGIKGVQYAAQFSHDSFGQGVGVFTGLVQHQPGNALVIPIQAPMLPLLRILLGNVVHVHLHTSTIMAPP